MVKDETSINRKLLNYENTSDKSKQKNPKIECISKTRIRNKNVKKYHIQWEKGRQELNFV